MKPGERVRRKNLIEYIKLKIMAALTEEYKELICAGNIGRRYTLSYRRYQKLSPEEKADFDAYKDQFLPKEWIDALIIKDMLGILFHHRLFRQCYKIDRGAYKKNPSEWMARYRTISRDDVRSYSPPANQIKDEYLEQEFIFQGFVPIDQYTIKIGYNYIASNRAINGKFYIYPKRFYGPKCYNKANFDKYPMIWDYFGGVGIDGVTRATQTEDEVKSLIVNQTWQIRQK